MVSAANNLAANIRKLRDERGLSQQRMAELSGIPRPTWASLESGSANPTLAVLQKVATAMQVSIEELIGTPKAEVQFFRAGFCKPRRRGGGSQRQLIPEKIPGLEIDRFELDPGGVITGVPHTQGTREYLSCEAGSIELFVSGERWLLAAGDAIVFRGDQKHSYRNPAGNAIAVGISVVCFS